MKPAGQIKEKLLPVLVSRSVIFFLFMCIFTLFIYAIGTSQNFDDSTQLKLLNLYAVLGFFLTTTSISGMVLNLLRFFRMKKPRYLLRAGTYLLLVIFGVATVLGVLVIVTISRGNG